MRHKNLQKMAKLHHRHFSTLPCQFFVCYTLFIESYNSLISVLCTVASMLDKYSLTANVKNMTLLTCK